MATQTFPQPSPAVRLPQTLLPQIDANPRIVAFAQTAAGKLAILATAAALFYVRGVRDPVFIAILGGILFLPQYAWTLMAIGGCYWMPSLIKGAFTTGERIGGAFLALDL